ncbi:hypothetical protein [Paenibacillus arenilitoris]|uniref:Carboxypeptidase regulatory-like domain-containing protein n=1 Tax=Paenibacillus arenilitoris TaxID=2772299 RepID=A0A927CHG8_9BACL|nr:hypothetical protein [Paenibacillus arenilitoris]MBD2867594.1 hypothetical protein [Paenibacillus arenilitoris]
MTRQRSVSVTRCSLVVSPVDVWTRRLPAPSALSVSLQGVQKKPIRKPDGTYLFLDLPPGSYALEVASPFFLPYWETIVTSELDPLSPLVTVPLMPGPGYAYPPSATGVTFLLCGEDGRPLPGAPVDAYIDDDSAARGRLAQETLEAGAWSASIGLLQGKTVAGESLLLRGQGKEELVRVAETLPGGGLRFRQPVKESYRRGAVLLPAVRTVSAPNGTVLLPLRGTLPPSFTVKASATSGKAAVSASLAAKAGQVAAAPPVTLHREK